MACLILSPSSQGPRWVVRPARSISPPRRPSPSGLRKLRRSAPQPSRHHAADIAQARVLTAEPHTERGQVGHPLLQGGPTVITELSYYPALRPLPIFGGTAGCPDPGFGKLNYLCM